jgi:hypothetical protein
MKKLYAFLPLLALPLMFIFLANSSGSPGGRTGSPGDNGNNCTGCHSGTPQTASGWIASDVPAGGYIGDETYMLNLTGTHTGVGRFGFELTAEDELGNKVGQFTITNSTETKLVNNNQAVTHTFAGTTPSGNSKDWEFQWTAPPGSTGNITFYATVNAANGDGGTSGDVIYLTVDEISPDVTSVAEIGDELHFYPNPSDGMVYFNPKAAQAGTEAFVYNVNGQQVHKFVLGHEIQQVSLSHLSKGIYFVKLNDDRAEMQKLVIR